MGKGSFCLPISHPTPPDSEEKTHTFVLPADLLLNLQLHRKSRQKLTTSHRVCQCVAGSHLTLANSFALRKFQDTVQGEGQSRICPQETMYEASVVWEVWGVLLYGFTSCHVTHCQGQKQLLTHFTC